MECRDSADTCSNFRSTVQALALSKATVTLFESISQLLDQDSSSCHCPAPMGPCSQLWSPSNVM